MLGGRTEKPIAIASEMNMGILSKLPISEEICAHMYSGA